MYFNILPLQLPTVPTAIAESWTGVGLLLLSGENIIVLDHSMPSNQYGVLANCFVSDGTVFWSIPEDSKTTSQFTIIVSIDCTMDYNAFPKK